MKRVLLVAPILIACGFLVAGTLISPRNFAKTLPAEPALTGQENAPEILGRGLQFLKKAKSTSYQADFIIEASQNGLAVPLFPAEFRLSYSAKLDKYFYEVTSPSIAVGSAILINRRPSLVARNSPPRDLFQKVGYVQELTEAEVADGCSGTVCNTDGQCGDCDSGEIIAASLKPNAPKPSSTFLKLLNTGAFDLPYLSDFSTNNSEKVKTVAYEGEMSSVVRFDRSLAAGVGLGDILMTVRHRDGAPVAFDFVNTAGETIKHMDASYVGLELTGLTATDNTQKLELQITLKSIGSINRNVQLDDSTFTRENLFRVLGKRQLSAE